MKSSLAALALLLSSSHLFGDDLAARVAALEEKVKLQQTTINVLVDLFKEIDEKSKEVKPKKEAGDTGKAMVMTTIKNKVFEAMDIRKDITEDSVTFNFDFELIKTNKKARALKGKLAFADLFNEIKFVHEFTLSEGLEPGKALKGPVSYTHLTLPTIYSV